MTAGPTTADERRALSAALVAVAPWTADTEAGPRAVDAGQCDRCGDQPRLLPTCGPVGWRALCRDCALAVDVDGWCEGHLDDAERLLAWAEQLPAWWGDAVVLAWVASGEVAWDATLGVRPDVPAPVRAALPPQRD